MENGDSCATCANTIILAETSLGSITQLRDILGRGGGSMWPSSRREAEEVALLVASLSGHCRMELSCYPLLQNLRLRWDIYRIDNLPDQY